jgi:hypothetical protein
MSPYGIAPRAVERRGSTIERSTDGRAPGPPHIGEHGLKAPPSTVIGLSRYTPRASRGWGCGAGTPSPREVSGDHGGAPCANVADRGPLVEVSGAGLARASSRSSGSTPAAAAVHRCRRPPRVTTGPSTAPAAQLHDVRLPIAGPGKRTSALRLGVGTTAARRAVGATATSPAGASIGITSRNIATGRASVAKRRAMSTPPTERAQVCRRGNRDPDRGNGHRRPQQGQQSRRTRRSQRGKARQQPRQRAAARAETSTMPGAASGGKWFFGPTP